jgi:MraZ protein
VTDFIREHTGITDEVAFVGRGHFFQMWEPEKFKAYRDEVRERLRAQREAAA